MRQEKKFIVEELTNEIRGVNPLIVTDQSKVKAKDINLLRQNLKALESNYRVVQNTLFQKALENTGLKARMGGISGHTAIAYGGKDIIEVIKLLAKFVKDCPDGFVIKGGLVDNQYLELNGLEQLAKLPPKNVLIARLIGQINAPLSRFAMVLNGSLQKLVYVLDSIAKRK